MKLPGGVMSPSASKRPLIRIVPGREKRVRDGHPWLYSNEVAMDEHIRLVRPGTIVDLVSAEGVNVGVATFNPHSLIAARLLARHADTDIDTRFFARRLASALKLRQWLLDKPYYRLVHAEADGLPGLIVDRFGDTVVLQANSAGMDLALPHVVDALTQTIHPTCIVLRNDSPARFLEGLSEDVRVIRGRVDTEVRVEENGSTFFADVMSGQKTGWFYDQRENRATIAALCGGARVADFYSYTGGFAIQCARAGAASVLAVDRSQSALDLAEKAAVTNGVEAKCVFKRADIFTEMRQLIAAGRKFEVVIADPPAFVKSRKDLGAGARAYRKLTRMASQLVVPGGFLLVCSCSHNMFPDRFLEQVGKGVHDAGRTGRILRSAGAAPDHPVHPFLPESAYLKTHLVCLD